MAYLGFSDPSLYQASVYGSYSFLATSKNPCYIILIGDGKQYQLTIAGSNIQSSMFTFNLPNYNYNYTQNTPLNKAFVSQAANMTYIYFNSVTDSPQSVRITWLLKGAKPPKVPKNPSLMAE